jgi:hypothetical protein
MDDLFFDGMTDRDREIADVLVRFVAIKSELLSALQNEIQRHTLSTFMSAEHKIVQTGCSICERHFGTVEQFKRHFTEDVLPPLLDQISSGTVRSG